MSTSMMCEMIQTLPENRRVSSAHPHTGRSSFELALKEALRTRSRWKGSDMSQLWQT